MLPPLDPASLVERPQNMCVTALNKPDRDRAISVAVLRQFLSPVSFHPDMMRRHSNDRVVEGHKIAWECNNPLRGERIRVERTATEAVSTRWTRGMFGDHRVSQESNNHAPLQVFLRPEHPCEAEVPTGRLIMPFVEEGRHGRAVNLGQLEHIGPDKDNDRGPAENKPQVS